MPGMPHLSNDVEKTRNDILDVKADTSVPTAVAAGEGDEALKLVGLQRTEEFSEEYFQNLRWKLDRIIPPLASLLYFMQYLDKTSISYAAIMGFAFTGQEFNLIAMGFFLGFLAWEFPTVYIAQKLPLGKYLGCNAILWGIVLMLHAVASNFSTFFALRFLLGIFESCVTPVLIQIISMFYKKDEQARRISWFVWMNGIAPIMGAFISYGVSFYTGKHVSPPYKILFLLLGGLAIVTGIAIVIWMPDSPLTARALNSEEKVAAVERIRNDQGGVANKMFKREQVTEALRDIRTWLLVLTCLLLSIPAGGISTFTNIIIRNFGYTSRQALILSAPFGAVSTITTLFIGWFSDTKRERMLPILFAVLPSILGAALLVGVNKERPGVKGALLFGIYLTGSFGSGLTAVYSYNASNTSGNTKRSTMNAIVLFTFSVGSIIGTEIFQPRDAPDYIPGKTAVLILLSIEVGVCLLIRWINIRENRRKHRLLVAMCASKGWSESDVVKERERHAFMDLTDKQNPFFFYVI